MEISLFINNVVDWVKTEEILYMRNWFYVSANSSHLMRCWFEVALFERKILIKFYASVINNKFRNILTISDRRIHLFNKIYKHCAYLLYYTILYINHWSGMLVVNAQDVHSSALPVRCKSLTIFLAELIRAEVYMQSFWTPMILFVTNL